MVSLMQEIIWCGCIFSKLKKNSGLAGKFFGPNNENTVTCQTVNSYAYCTVSGSMQLESQSNYKPALFSTNTRRLLPLSKMACSTCLHRVPRGSLASTTSSTTSAASTT